MKIAIVGATGLVGSVMLEVLEQSNIAISEVIPVASPRSQGKKIQFKNKEYTVVSHEEAIAQRPEIALFSAGGSTSLEWAPKYAQADITVIDNSSAWRMDPKIKLVVPEINANLLTEEDKIIANPNCSTIQMVVALGNLHQKFKIKRLVISTYQSFTGTGVQAVEQYNTEKADKISENPAYPHPIFANCIPHCDIFLDNDYTKEEMKLVHETRKILGDESIAITATAVRVPVDGGHSESINIEFINPYDIKDIRHLIEETSGVVLMDDLKNNQYPTPLQAKAKNEVFVGRIRRDESIENGLNLWVVADNLRKGAATNTIQIAEYLINNELVRFKKH